MSSGKLYSLPVPNVLPKPGETVPYRHPLVVNDSQLPTNFDPPFQSLYDIFLTTVDKYPNKEFLGTRKFDPVSNQIGGYQWKTYSQISTEINHFGSALNELGLSKDDSVGLFSINREEWIIAEYACYRMGYITVPLYDTLGYDSIQHIVNQANITVLVTTPDKAGRIMEHIDKYPSLRHIIIMDALSKEPSTLTKNNRISIHLFSEMLLLGMKNLTPACPQNIKGIMTICYTSGTTDLPKGVVLPHSAIVATIAGLKKLIDAQYVIDLSMNEVHLSYLPFAHIFERVVTVLLIYLGASIGFYQGDTLKILNDIGELKPTVFVSVPRLYNRIYDKVFAGIKEKSYFSQILFNYAYDSKIKALHSRGTLTHWLWDRLIFSNIRNRLGGRVRAMITGAAPISSFVMDFLRVAFYCEVYEGYGQTETCAASCLTQKHDYTTGYIGCPTPQNEMKLVDVPEMNYLINQQPPRGEIWFRGNNCFTEYYKDPRRTNEAIDPDGWVCTGDIGELDPQGRVRIIDRKKNIFKLAQGEYIAPEKIEMVLLKSSFIEQIFVYGESLQSTLIAIVVPTKEIVISWAKNNLKEHKYNEGLSEEDQYTAIITNFGDQLENHILKDMSTIARSTGLLKGFEIPKAIYIETTPFSVENNLLTSSFKLKRFEIANHYKSRIHELYSKSEQK